MSTALWTSGLLALSLSIGWCAGGVAKDVFDNALLFEARVERCNQADGVPFQPVRGGVVLCLRKDAVIDVGAAK